MKILKKTCIPFMFLWMIISVNLFVDAAYPDGLTKSAPIMGYPLSRTKKVVLYKDAARTNVKKRLSYQEFAITRQEADSFYVSYSVGKRKGHGWVKKSAFFKIKEDYKVTQSFANTTLLMYKNTKTGEVYKTIPKYSGGATVGEKEGWKQMLFYTNDCYYLGWLTNSSYTSVRRSMDTTEQVLADGYYKISNPDKKKTFLEFSDLDKKALLKKSKNENARIFQLTYEGKDGYLIRPYKQKGYLSVSDEHLVISETKTYWNLIRKEGYFVLEESGSGKVLSYTNGSGITLKKQKKKLTGQNWLFTKTTVDGYIETPTVFSQYDPKWGGSIYCNGYSPRTIASSGCGVVSLVNAIYALNGQYISPVMLANFSNSRGHYVYMQGTLDSLYPDFASEYGETYHFRYAGRANDYYTLRNHLQNGGTAIALVPGHYMAITDYRASDNAYLVLDSAITGTRPTTIHGDWVNQGRLTYGSMGCYYFHLFSTK